MTVFEILCTMSYSGCFATYCVLFDLLFVVLVTVNLCRVLYFLTPERPIKNLFWKKSANLTGKHLHRSLFFNRISGLKLYEKKKERCFCAKFAKF